MYIWIYIYRLGHFILNPAEYSLKMNKFGRHSQITKKVENWMEVGNLFICTHQNPSIYPYKLWGTMHAPLVNLELFRISSTLCQVVPCMPVFHTYEIRITSIYKWRWKRNQSLQFFWVTKRATWGPCSFDWYTCSHVGTMWCVHQAPYSCASSQCTIAKWMDTCTLYICAKCPLLSTLNVLWPLSCEHSRENAKRWYRRCHQCHREERC